MMFLVMMMWMVHVASPFSAVPRKSADQSWNLWPALPLAPYGYRKTLMNEVVKGRVWTFDQLQGTLYVHVPVRMTVVKRNEGGLVCYCPVAPTKECTRLLRDLESEHGKVTDVILPSLAVEHKAFVGPFHRKFPGQFWYTPGQYSFPLNFKNLRFVGILNAKTVEEGCLGPEFELATLGPIIPPGNGGFGETAIFHKPTKSLLLVDTLVSVSRDAPDIVKHDPRPLLFHARDDVRQKTTEADFRRGWERLVLFAFFFQPAALTVVPLSQSFKEASKECGMPGVFGWADLYPFEWNGPEAKKSFDTLVNKKLFVAPILRELILNRDPQAVLDWVAKLEKFDFKRIIPAHMDPTVSASPRDLKPAFRFLTAPNERAFVEGDLQALRDAESGLVESGEIYPRGKRN